MRHLRLPLAAAIAALSLPASAGAHTVHTVAPGDTLWSIAAANNLTTVTVAAYNGLSEDAGVIAGTQIEVPTVAEGATALAGTAPAAEQPADGTVAESGAAPAPQGGYVVRAGDTLSGLAAQSGVSIAQMAAANGLAADAQIVEGTVLKLPQGAPAPASSSQPEPEARVVPDAAPHPSPGVLDGSRVSTLASEHGVDGSLAAAIGWQESGFNNAMVSSANARGVMQVLPGTWDWVQSNLAGDRVLDPASAEDNVRAGSLYLNHLLQETAGDVAMAAASYYQGLSSVREIGMLPETRRYVDNVLALRGRFGG